MLVLSIEMDLRRSIYMYHTRNGWREGKERDSLAYPHLMCRCNDDKWHTIQSLEDRVSSPT